MDLTFEVREIIRVLKKRWLLIVVFLAAGVAASYLNLSLQKPEYTATSSFIVGASTDSKENLDYTAYAATHQLVYTCESLISSDAVLNEAIKAADVNATPQTLTPKISAKMTNEGDMITVSVTLSSPDKAIKLADAIVGATKSRLETLSSTIPATLTIIDNASVDKSETLSSHYAKTLFLGGFIGVLLSLAILLISSAASSRVIKEQTAKRLTELPSLGLLPDTQADPALQEEAYRILKSGIRAASSSGHTIAVASARPADGRSSAAIGLSRALAGSGFTTLLVETDFRKPSLARQLGLRSDRGFADFLAGRCSESDVIQPLSEGLDILPAGESASGHYDLLDSQKAADALDSLRGRYSYVILDTPAVGLAPEAAIVSRLADSTVLLVRYGVTRFSDLTDAVQKLKRAGARLSGFVFAGIPQRTYLFYAGDMLRYK